MPKELHQFVGRLPDRSRIYPAHLALPSDEGWLRDNPEAVARVRTFRDDTRADMRVTLMAVRLLDPSVPDGWRVAHVEAHPAHGGSTVFQTWVDRPGDMVAANDLALTILTADADTDTDGGHAGTVLSGLVVPDLAELPSHWLGQFAPIASRPTAEPLSKDKTMNASYAFTGPIYEPEHDPQRPTDAEELAWLKANPTQVAHIRRSEVPLDETLSNIMLRVFEFSVRVRDEREPDGWRLARFDLPATAFSFYGLGITLDDDWPKMAGRTDLKNMFVLSALSEGAYTGTVWTGEILKSLALPDTSELDPAGWRQFFSPYDPTTNG